MVKTKSLTEGPIFSRLFLFTLPIMASGLLQVMYNMADNIVVGSFSGNENAVGAIGSTAALTTLIVNFLMGFATGSGVIIAQSYGAKDKQSLKSAMHTAAAIALIGGISFATIAFIFSENLLVLMETKNEFKDYAVTYFRIICVGIPASTVYNFGAAALRSLGDSKKPLYILGTTGLINVILNLVFVIGFHMTVEGVAIATVTAQYLSAIAVVYFLLKQDDENCRLKLKEICINRNSLIRILKIALPTSLQSSLFAISNIFIQIGSNQLLAEQVSAKTIAGNIDNLVYTAVNSCSHTAMTFVAQNYGAKRFDRIKKISLYTVIQVCLVGIILGQLILLFGRDIAGIYIDQNASNRQMLLDYTLEVMTLILNIYFMCGIMDSLAGMLRGLGNSFLPMIIGVLGICGLRMVWIFVFFPMDMFHNLTGLYLSYPITWVFCIIALGIALAVEWRKKKKLLSNTEVTAIAKIK